MKTVWNWAQAVFTAIGGFLGWFLGGLDGFLYALIAFVAIDYVTGVMCAIVDKKLSSEVGAKGIFKKVLIFVLVVWTHNRQPGARQWRGGNSDSSDFLLPK